MNLAEINLNLLSAFEALFEERNVTRAARRLGIGQPAMSDALRRLRALFGDELFRRASGAMQPTPRARDIAAEMGPLLAALRTTLGAQIAFFPASADKVFTIASTDFTTLVLLPALSRHLQREAPNVDLRIVGYDKDAAGDMLDRGEVDMAIGVFPDPPDNTVRSTLFEERFVGLVRADHPALIDGTMDLARFADLPHALASVRRDARGAVDDALAARGLRRRVALVVPYMLLLPKVLAGSNLVCVLPERVARSVAGPELHAFPLPLPMESWSVDMLWNPSARTDKATAWMRQLIVRTAATL